MPYAGQYMGILSDCLQKVANDFGEISRMDTNCQERTLECNEKLKEFVEINSAFSVEGQSNVLGEEITSRLDQLEKLCDDKIEYAQELYAIVEENIRKLEQQFQQNQEALREQLSSKCTDDTNRSTKKHNEINSPIDPNEPTYCTCLQISYGKMIMCDNKDCQIEWFHFPCVGISEAPEGEWYCKFCTAERENSRNY